MSSRRRRRDGGITPPHQGRRDTTKGTPQMNHHTRSTARRTRILGTAVAATAVLAGGYAATSMQASYADTPDDLRAASSASSAAGKADQVKLKLHVDNDALAECFPHAKAKVKVDLTT